VFYIFALERAVESKNRVLENQLLVTVHGKASTNEFIFFLSLFSVPFFVRSVSASRSCPCLCLEKDHAKSLKDCDRLLEMK